MAGKTSMASGAAQEGQGKNWPELKGAGKRIAWHLLHLTRLASIGAIIVE
jgi:hypothetical protein